MHKPKLITIRVRTLLDKYLLTLIIITSVIAGGIAFVWSYQHGYIYSYGDAKSHLNIARRAFDSLTPGIVQLGTSWLPLYHIMMFPFIWNNFLWHSGIAATYINYILYLASVALLFKSILLITKRPFAAIFGSLLFALNVNVLYLQAAAMTEIPTVFFIILSTYLFIRWQKERHLHLLISLGLSCFFGTLIRYEMWAVVLSLIPAIVLSFISMKKKRLNFKRLEAELVLFSTLAFFGIVLWLLWNYIFFGDPLSFQRGIWSAKSYQLSQLHNNLPYKNIFQAFKFYFFASGNMNTWSITVVGIVGALLYLAKKRSLQTLALVGLCGSIFVFEAYSLYSGNTTIYVPQLYPYDYYNVRYGIYALPFLILFLSYILGGKNKILPSVLVLILMFETFLGYRSMPISLYDAAFSKGPVMSDKTISTQREMEVVSYMHSHYKSGLILTSAGVNDGLIFLSGFDMKNFITEGNQKYWEDSLIDPTKYATWIIIRDVNRSDIRNPLTKLISENKLSGYKKVMENSEFKIYKR